MSQREEFEKWLKFNKFSQCDLSKNNGEYVVPSVHLCWLSWQVSHQSQTKRIAELEAQFNVATKLLDERKDEIERLKQMIDLGLGWEDLANDMSPQGER